MMGKRLVGPHSLACIILLITLLAGCAEESTNKQVSSSKKTRPPVKKEVVEPVVEDTEAVKQRFVYSATGRRDPFEPLIKKGENKKVNNIPLTPLQRFDLSQFRLQAVLIGKGEPRAMVGAPDGKTYILTIGTKIGKREGVVKQITRDSVQINEVHYDLTGSVSHQNATIDMPEQKPF